MGTGTGVLVSYFFPLRKWDWSSDVRLSYKLKERYEMAKEEENLEQVINTAIFWASLYLLFGFNSEGRDLEIELCNTI